MAKTSLPGVVLLGTGSLLLWSAIQGVNPLYAIKAALTGKPVGRDWANVPVAFSPDPGKAPQTGAGTSLYPDAQLWVWPVPSHKSTSAKFGDRGSSWSSGVHTGLDIPCPVGTPVVSATNMKVISAGNSGAYGKSIVGSVIGASGTTIRYAHLSQIGVKRGQTVGAAERIGLSGATGNTTGPHLHIEVRVNGRAVDPAPYLAGKYNG